jgi:hypothetical protein
MRSSVSRNIQVSVTVLFLALVAYAKVTGPDAGYTGAPNDIGSCVACHDTFHEANVGPGNVQILTLPAVYTPGQQYSISVRTQQGGRDKFGFQLTAVTQTGNRAGTFTPLDNSTQVNPSTGVGGRQYMEHTEQGTDASIVGSRIWQLRWTAPASDVGTVTFYVAGNAANNDGTNQNDFIYTNTALSDSPTSHVEAEFESQPGGQTLNPDNVFNISWTATGTSNIDNYEVRYSTDDGATFPITNLILATTDPSRTEVNWTVPNKPTNQARIRLVVGKKSGDAVQLITNRFIIAGAAGGPPVPAIFNASVNGKKLFVSGESFGAGAQLFSCTDCEVPVEEGKKVKKVFNDSETPSSMLFAKKAGKDIPKGATVILQVKNPDGTASEPFSFTRPPD